MGKFKVGDRVKVKNIEVGTASYGYGFAPAMSKYIGKKFTIENDYGDGVYRLVGMGYFWAEGWLEHVKPETIVIYRDGDKTLAFDKRTGKKAEAKCSKEDTYDFHTGAKIAFERLIGEDKAKEEPKPKLYNGKVVCVTSQYVYLTKGKIYEFKDGYSKYDNGDRMPIRLIDKSGEITSSDERLADFLLANGVVVLPCKVRDTVYIVNNGKILEEKLVKTSIWYETEYYGFDESRVGRDLFFTREEAEEALEKMKGE